MKTSLSTLAIVTAALLLLPACSTEAQMRAVDPAGEGTPATSTTEPTSAPVDIPPAEGEVETRESVFVVDAGEGPQLCLGAVTKSYPPQCSGLPITGWDWEEHPEHQEASGTRWGVYSLTGTFDGTTFDVVRAEPAGGRPTMAIEETEPGTPCKAPKGGWKVVDPGTTDSESLDATLTAASALEGYATAWFDQTIDPTSSNPVGNKDLKKPNRFVLNVAVTGDITAAEQQLRKTWGGALCVSKAEHTERELQDIQSELNTLPGVLSSGSPRPDLIELEVVHDDGSIQAWVDEQYGAGLVAVTSALAPADEPTPPVTE